MLLIDIYNGGSYDFYYNMVKEVNQHVVDIVGNEKLKQRPISPDAMRYVFKYQHGKLMPGMGPAGFGMIGSMDSRTGRVEYASAFDGVGIVAAQLTKELAEEAMLRAYYYCPKNTGKLASSFRIQEEPDGSYTIINDCDYAWYVHEYSWKKHDFPTCSHFLKRAINEVAALSGMPHFIKTTDNTVRRR